MFPSICWIINIFKLLKIIFYEFFVVNDFRNNLEILLNKYFATFLIEYIPKNFSRVTVAIFSI